jgi:hypothetical protein
MEHKFWIYPEEQHHGRTHLLLRWQKHSLEPVTIGNRADFDKMLRKLDGMDVLEWARQQRPNTKYMVERLANLTVFIDKIIGRAIGM